jgi:transcriptional regulator with PAS, ATPase and Fis domain
VKQELARKSLPGKFTDSARAATMHSSQLIVPRFPKVCWSPRCSATPEAPFTGAVGRRDGLLMQCHGGTAFLDEVGELPLMLQAKFLRTIQNESFTPVGENREVRIDTRFISATSRDLEQEIAAGRFRRDLYYRLAVIHLKLPPLRERLEDLESITSDLFRQLRTPQQSAEDFSPEAWTLLRRHNWPGNVRELRNVVERGLSLAQRTTD